MKEPECKEGPEARENFERGMKALFKVPKANIVPPKERAKNTASKRKSKNFQQGPEEVLRLPRHRRFP
jgi:hypothetical protein